MKGRTFRVRLSPALVTGAQAGVHEDLHDELAAAIAAERAAWENVKNKLPGTPGHVAADWLAWQTAVRRCRAARQALDAAGVPRKAVDRPQDARD